MSKAKILLVEDERITAEDLKNTLENIGYQVTGIASSADTFYTCLQSEIPDLVLMDIYLKGNKDGIELAIEIKEKYQIPVIYLTAYSDTHILERAKITEPFGYILKPFQERELHSNIEMALHKNRMEKQIHHLNETLKAIRDVNQIIVRVESREELLQKTCATLISTRAYSSSWFLIFDNQGVFLDVAHAGLNENTQSFANQFKNGYIPPCIEQLNANSTSIYSIHNIQKCNDCPLVKLFPDKSILITKVRYQDRLHGYLAVSMPEELATNEEEIALFIEISDDLGLALNNLEQKEKKEAAEASQRISEEKFRTLYENAPMAYQSLDENGCLIDINPMWEKTLGYRRDEIIGKWFGDFLHPDSLPQFSINFPAFKKRGNIKNVQFKLRKKNGDYILVSFESSIGYHPDGTFRQTYSVFQDITEQKKSETALFESETRFRHAFDFAATSMNIIGLDGKFQKINIAFTKLLGYTEDELEELHFNDITHPEDVNTGGNFLEKIVKGEIENASFEKRYISKNKKIIWVYVFVSLVRDESNNPKFFITHIIDLTERKQAEQELQKLSQVVKQSPASVVVTDTNGTIEYANPATSMISGYSTEELIGENPRVLKSGETTTEEYKTMWETIKSGNEWKGEFHNRKKNGELYWERASISPITNSKGEITHFLGIKEDITEHKHRENVQHVLFNISKQVFETGDVHQLLEIVKKELSTLIDTKNFYVAFYHKDTDMLSMAYRIDEQDSFTNWPAEKSLTGYVIKHNKSVMLKQEDFQKLLDAGEVELIGVVSEIWLGVPLTVNGKPYGAIVVQDYHNPNAYDEDDLKLLEFIASQVSLSIQRQKSILEMKEAFDKADAGDRLKTAFINNISHEIRTPLNGILGFTEMTLNPDTSPEEHELFFSVIKKSSKRLLNTINSYMDISLLVSGTLEIIRRPLNLDKLIKEIYVDFSQNAELKNIELSVINPNTDSPVILNTDIEKLRKIITHLLDNAFKFTLKGTIAFGYEIKDSEIEFIVSDTGSGIKTEALNIIFDAFMQADVSSTRGYEGSGLGLTIANGLVKILGGNLRIDTERGKGSKFYFTLPFSENPILTPQKIIDVPKPQEQLNKQLILVAEDDDSNFKYIEIVLLYASYQVLRAENGIEVVEICRNHPEISLVLMDIKMPLMDGFEATKQIRTFMPGLPIIALTAHVTPEDENNAIAAGCNEYVTKPVSKTKLLEIIEYTLVSA